MHDSVVVSLPHPTFTHALDEARARGASHDALVAHLVPVLRWACVHGGSRELAARVRELAAMGEVVVAHELADALERTGRSDAAARLRARLGRLRPRASSTPARSGCSR